MPELQVIIRVINDDGTDKEGTMSLPLQDIDPELVKSPERLLAMAKAMSGYLGRCIQRYAEDWKQGVKGNNYFEGIKDWARQQGLDESLAVAHSISHAPPECFVLPTQVLDPMKPELEFSEVKHIITDRYNRKPVI